MWTCVCISHMQHSTSQTNRVLSLQISLNITGLANVHLQDLSIYTYDYFNTRTFMYWTQDRDSTSKLWKLIYVANLKSHILPWIKLHAHPTGSNTDAVNMTVKNKINSQLTALLRFYFTFLFSLLSYIFHWGCGSNKHYSKTQLFLNSSKHNWSIKFPFLITQHYPSTHTPNASRLNAVL
jgi:hypothetical protein